jgi:hypothetical protein
MRYWVMRVDHKNARAFIWAELKAGRLRQGWGYQSDQDIGIIAARRKKGAKLSEEQRDAWRGNRRMLPSESDSIQHDDIVLVPHVPHDRHWSVARVVGSYRFQIPEKPVDYGHILPVELISHETPVSFLANGVAAGLRQTMRNMSRLWNIDHLGADVNAIVKALAQPKKNGLSAGKLDRLADLLTSLEDHGWDRLKHHYQGAEFEAPCIRLLEALYGEGNVEHTGGKNERGADAICSYLDPLGVPHRVAVQIKMWTWEADWTRPLEQIRKAVDSYDGITAGVILSTSEKVTAKFEAERIKLEKKLGVPVRVLLRRDLLRLFMRHLPALVGDDADGAA